MLRFDRRRGENALRSARTNLIAPPRGRKDADHKSGGPRYPLIVRHPALGARKNGAQSAGPGLEVLMMALFIDL